MYNWLQNCNTCIWLSSSQVGDLYEFCNIFTFYFYFCFFYAMPFLSLKMNYWAFFHWRPLKLLQSHVCLKIEIYFYFKNSYLTQIDAFITSWTCDAKMQKWCVNTKTMARDRPEWRVSIWYAVDANWRSSFSSPRTQYEARFRSEPFLLLASSLSPPRCNWVTWLMTTWTSRCEIDWKYR